MKRRFCELNVVESPSFNQNVANIKQLIKLGYHVVCINRKMKAPEKVNKYTGKPSEEEIHSFANVMKKLKAEVSALKESPEVDFKIPDDFQLISRVTVDLDTTDQIRLLRNTPYKEILNDADIIAVCPKEEAVFKVIAEGKIDCDLISFQLEGDLDFKPTHAMIGLATAKNISYEISYSHAIKSISLRKYIFKNGISLVQRCKKGKGVILSCHGDNPLDFRSPQDVINLGHLFEMNDTICHDVVSKNCMDVITHAKLRKLTFKGAVAVQKISDDEEETPVAKKRKIEI